MRIFIMTDMIACACCGELAPVSALELSFRLPDDVFQLSKTEQGAHCRMSSEYIVLNDNRFFVRALIPLPVHGRAEPYHIGIWAEVSKKNFIRVLALSAKPAQASAPPIPATLANQLPFHKSTLGLSLTLQLRGPDTVPEVQLRPCEHTLYAEQSNGIDEARVLQYAQPVLQHAHARGSSPDAPAKQG
jgi:hypothetical protein